MYTIFSIFIAVILWGTALTSLFNSKRLALHKRCLGMLFCSAFTAAAYTLLTTGMALTSSHPLLNILVPFLYIFYFISPWLAYVLFINTVVDAPHVPTYSTVPTRF